MRDLKNYNAEISKNMIYFNSSPWLTIKEACNYLKCGSTKIRQLIECGELPSYRLDKNKRSVIRILKRDINHYMLFQKKVRLSNYEKELLNQVSE